MNKVYFAKIDDNNIVEQIIVVDGNTPLSNGGILSSDPTNVEGEMYCRNTFGGNWKAYSRTGEFRKNPAGIGKTWDVTRNAFIPKKQFDSFIFNETTCRWEPPTPRPTTLTYDAGAEALFNVIPIWSEDNLRWEASGPNNEILVYNYETNVWSIS
jgi:hypothetical protein